MGCSFKANKQETAEGGQETEPYSSAGVARIGTLERTLWNRTSAPLKMALPISGLALAVCELESLSLV